MVEKMGWVVSGLSFETMPYEPVIGCCYTLLGLLEQWALEDGGIPPEIYRVMRVAQEMLPLGQNAEFVRKVLERAREKMAAGDSGPAVFEWGQ